MFDIGFSELLLVLVIGLVVLGPERLPVAVRTVAGWIRTLRAMAASVQNELTQELKLQELQDSLKKAEEAGLKNISPEIKASMDELKEAADVMQRSIRKESDEVTASIKEATSAANTIHNPVVKDPEAYHDEGISPASAEHVATAPETAPEARVTETIVSQPARELSVQPAHDKPETVVQPASEQALDASVQNKPASSTQPTGER
ncbi:Sec-independent protein translocase protein TatB [Rouxiella sp. Mn2063]|uniref:Sec-independent protein translocase protein TatB n=1 Tax=Rouxiella sp. Mn2063 TaxID=3395262 RepID=UPI003BD6FE35